MYLSDKPWRELNGTWLKIEGLIRFVLISASTKSSWRTHEVSMLKIPFYFIFKLWIMSNSIECKTIGNRSQIFVNSDITLIKNHQKNKRKWEQASLTWQKNSIPSSISLLYFTIFPHQSTFKLSQQPRAQNRLLYIVTKLWSTAHLASQVFLLVPVQWTKAKDVLHKSQDYSQQHRSVE